MLKIAVLFSPNAGCNIKYTEISNTLSQKLIKHDLFACQCDNKRPYLPSAALVEYDTGSNYKEIVRNITRSLLKTGAELLICVGGDGIASYAAGEIIAEGLKVPILGIAAGTANVGPIISITPEQLQKLDIGQLNYIRTGGIKVNIDNCTAGYGFNDVVIGNTVLGTIEGKMVNLSVEKMVSENCKEAVNPSSYITTDGFIIKKCGKLMSRSIKKPAQIIISPLEVDNFYGRAVTGGLCLSAHSSLKAAVALLERIIITSCENDMAQNSFLACEHLLFAEGDVLELSGLSSDGHVVIDGNPYIREDDAHVFIEYISGLITVARMKEC